MIRGRGSHVLKIASVTQAFLDLLNVGLFHFINQFYVVLFLYDCVILVSMQEFDVSQKSQSRSFFILVFSFFFFRVWYLVVCWKTMFMFLTSSFKKQKKKCKYVCMYVYIYMDTKKLGIERSHIL